MGGKYLSTGDHQLDLTTVSAHKSTELVDDLVQQTETVVLSKCAKEVLDDVTLVSSDLLELCDDGLLVGDSEGRGGDDAGELGVGVKGSTKVVQGLGGGIEGGSLGGGSVLFVQFQVNYHDIFGC